MEDTREGLNLDELPRTTKESSSLSYKKIKIKVANATVHVRTSSTIKTVPPMLLSF
jgi:hypothetical protein